MNDHDTVPAPEGAGPGEDPIAEIVDEASDALGASAAAGPISVEDLIDQLERVTAERDGHFDARARLQAEFDNYRKRMATQQAEQAERAAEGLVGRLLPVLDEIGRAHV